MRRSRFSIKNIWQLLLIIWHEDKILFTAYFISSFLGAVLLFVVFFAYKLMIDQISKMGSTFTFSLFIVLISYLFFEYVSRFVNFTFNLYFFDYIIRAKLQNALTRKFLEKLARLDFAHLENGEIRNLIAKIENNYTFKLPELLLNIREKLSKT